MENKPILVKGTNHERTINVHIRSSRAKKWY